MAAHLSSASTVDVEQLRQWIALGALADASQRAVAWKLLLDYLPLAKDDWVRPFNAAKKA
jgi:hypothetical protein